MCFGCFAQIFKIDCQNCQFYSFMEFLCRVGIKKQTAEQYSRLISANTGLFRARNYCRAIQALSDISPRTYRQNHHNKRQRGQCRCRYSSLPAVLVKQAIWRHRSQHTQPAPANWCRRVSRQILPVDRRKKVAIKRLLLTTLQSPNQHRSRSERQNARKEWRQRLPASFSRS